LKYVLWIEVSVPLPRYRVSAFFAIQSVCVSVHPSVRLCLSVRHTGRSVKC